jgi:GNAT superfamily N-acetyltransferase
VGEVSIRFLEGEADAGTLRTLYDTVIAPSFAPAEREPFEKLRRVLAADGEPVGALFLEWFADIRAALLCYFAVRPDLRDQGIGRRLVAVATPHWRTELEPRVVFAEAGDPRFDTTPTTDYGDGDARLRLYAGFGARRLPIPYLMPELSPGAGRLHNLLLLAMEAGPEASPAPDRIRASIVEDFLLRYFTRQEGDPLRDDDGLRELLAACRRDEFLPLLGVSST